MYRKYRVIIFTTRGRQLAAAADSVNGLGDMVKYWFINDPVGRSVYDDQIQAVAIYEFDDSTAQYINIGQMTSNSRADAVAKIRILGAR